jgi:hypothetical protein
MNVYELDEREPVLEIDLMGEMKILRPDRLETYETLNGKTVFLAPRVLFAEVPVIIHTTWGFSLVPTELASDETGDR